MVAILAALATGGYMAPGPHQKVKYSRITISPKIAAKNYIPYVEKPPKVRVSWTTMLYTSLS